MPRRRKFALLVLAALAVPAASGTTVAVASAAAAGCRVDYTVASRWDSGFTADVRITNLGDPVPGWRLTFTFTGAETVAQAWNAAATQTGRQVTATNVAHNAALPTGAQTSFGFQGAGSPATPSAFALNGTACTGTPAPTSPTTPPSSPPAPPASPTAPAGGWSPPGNLAGPLDEVWRHQESTYANLYGFRNYGWDQIMANGGYLNYCVRWDSPATVSAAQRDAVHAALQRQVRKWMDVMAGHNGWPYAEVPVRVVGWAVRDRAQLQWTDDSVDVYVGDIRENAPQCSEPCGRFFHQSGTYPTCPGGVAHHYDQSLWLTAGLQGGAGGDWGQRVGSEYFIGALQQSDIHILQHEIGHTFGLDDFYDWSPAVGGFLMKAGSATRITDFDAWMLRDWWRHLKSRYGS